MPPFQRPQVLILTSDPQARRRLANLVVEAAEIVDGDPSNAEFDVLVTDLSSDAAGQFSRPADEAEDAEKRGPGKATVLGIGPATKGWADMTLSEDCTSGEVRVACVLLGEIARLRKDRELISQIHQETKLASETDPLTGLPNRRAWDRQLKIKCDRVHANPRPLWLAIVDLDHFKPINDRSGMVEGDRVLAQTARALAGQLRGTDVIARLGGDEFGVLLSEIDEQSALGVFDRLRAAVAALAVETSAGPLTASIGFAGASQNCSAAELFAAAERGLRQAKQAGGNRACS